MRWGQIYSIRIVYARIHHKWLIKFPTTKHKIFSVIQIKTLIQSQLATTTFSSFFTPNSGMSHHIWRMKMTHIQHLFLVWRSSHWQNSQNQPIVCHYSDLDLIFSQKSGNISWWQTKQKFLSTKECNVVSQALPNFIVSPFVDAVLTMNQVCSC